LKGLILAQNER